MPFSFLVLQAKQQQVMGLAFSPGKGIFSTAFMLWMSGSSIQIFSLLTLGMALVNPIKAMSSVGTTFAKFKSDGVDIMIPQLIFLSLNLLALGVAVYKCSSMGLLPVTSADWTEYIPLKQASEIAGLSL